MPQESSKRAKPGFTRRAFLRGLAVGTIGSVAMSGYAEQHANSLRLERSELRLRRWDADGFRVAVLADVHVNFPAAVDRARRAVAMALAERPDVLVVVGDFVNSASPPVLRNVATTFEQVGGAQCPCVAVLGNHDYWISNPQGVIQAVEGTGLKLLRNETFEVEGVTIAGVDDAIVGRADPRFILEGPASGSLLALLHEPDYVSMLPDLVSLQISGHSHGGQFCLPFGVAVHKPHGARRFTSGFYPDAPLPLYVTRGVGTTGLDFRTFCPPEVSLLTLRCV